MNESETSLFEIRAADLAQRFKVDKEFCLGVVMVAEQFALYAVTCDLEGKQALGKLCVQAYAIGMEALSKQIKLEHAVFQDVCVEALAMALRSFRAEVVEEQRKMEGE